MQLIFLKLQKQSNQVLAKFIDAITGGNYNYYAQPLCWFELGIYLNKNNPNNIEIMVYSQITILHYLLLTVYRLNMNKLIHFPRNILNLLRLHYKMY